MGAGPGRVSHQSVCLLHQAVDVGVVCRGLSFAWAYSATAGRHDLFCVCVCVCAATCRPLLLLRVCCWCAQSQSGL